MGDPLVVHISCHVEWCFDEHNVENTWKISAM